MPVTKKFRRWLLKPLTKKIERTVDKRVAMFSHSFENAQQHAENLARNAQLEREFVRLMALTRKFHPVVTRIAPCASSSTFDLLNIKVDAVSADTYLD
ncbi:hypothetical protein [Hyphomicrobium sp. MC1]|uniref:hypothetical protein n=2 Tax=unclassified Hyphomicrobium TaxID=2619925 RepID=UPI00045EC454|nr:hypothetical protein [Hyphomicrobium sp. MC1]